MKRRNPLALLGAWLGLALAPHATQAADSPIVSVSATGTVAGRVQNTVTGQYLNNVRISIRGTSVVVFTDQLGFYRIVDAPSGPQVLDVFYTDLDPQELRIEVPQGGSIEQDIGLSSVARYGQNVTVHLDPFLVASNRETDADALAINEQRFAANIKNVVATDAMGDILGLSAGEFLKHLPGVTGEYDASQIYAVAIRGIGSDMTSVESDGMSSVSAAHGPVRNVNVFSMSISQVSRIEVTKVPTPANAADSLAGSVNMISKTAFERRDDELKYGFNVTGNLKAFNLKRTPHAYYDRNTYKIYPGFDFDYSKQFGKNFGIILTAMSTRTHVAYDFSNRIWEAGGTATGASISQPYLRAMQVYGSERLMSRSHYGFRADWRTSPNSVLTFGARLSKSISARRGATSITFNAGTNGNPTPASGVGMSFGPSFTAGATGRGAVSLSYGPQFGNIDGSVMDVHYRLDDGRWKINASYNYGESKALLNPDGFSSISAVLRVPTRVEFSAIGDVGTPVIRVFDNANQEVDASDIDNYRVTTAALGNNHRNVFLVRSGKLDLGRRLDVLAFPTTLQGGTQYRVQSRDRRTDTAGSLTFAGSAHPAAPYQKRLYTQQSVMGYPDIPSLSTDIAYEAYKANPDLFAPRTVAQLITAEHARLNTSEYAQEAVSAYYLQAEAYLLNNRLRVLGGVRYERTDIEGEGLLFDQNLVYLRNADGSFARDAQGLRIRKPEAGAPGSLEEAHFVRHERGYAAKRSYDGYYPSLHLTYNVKENFLARLAYAKTYGRPNFTQLIPNATFNEADLDEDDLDNPNVVRGNLTLRNTGLRPWTSDNYDLSLEYYTTQGGIFSGGVFLKEITDFFGTSVKLATLADVQELGLDSRYVGWNISTLFNSGDARVSGVELNARQSLRRIGGWAQYFTLFGNVTRLKLDGNPHATFTAFVPTTANWGVSFNWKRLGVISKWTYQGQVKGIASPAHGPDGFNYRRAFTIMDLNVVFRLSGNLSLTGSINNVLNEFNIKNMSYGSATPAYARRTQVGEYGPAFSLGIKGTF